VARCSSHRHLDPEFWLVRGSQFGWSEDAPACPHVSPSPLLIILFLSTTSPPASFSPIHPSPLIQYSSQLYQSSDYHFQSLKSFQSNYINQNDWRKIWRQGLWLQERPIVSRILWKHGFTIFHHLDASSHPKSASRARQPFETICWLVCADVHPRLVSHSQSVVSTDFSERATTPSVLVLVPQSTSQLFLSTWLPKSSSWLVTPPETTRRRVLSQDICNSPSEMTRNWTSSSDTSQSPKVVSCQTFTRVRYSTFTSRRQLLTAFPDLLPKKTAKPGKGQSQEL